MFKRWEELASPDCPVTFTGQQVRSIREDVLKLSKAEMATRLSVTRQCISNWERDGVDIVRTCALRFAAIYPDCL